MEGGADDYVSKPFNMKELYLRIQAALRQVAVLKSLHVSTYAVGPLLLDTRRHLVPSVISVSISLSPSFASCSS